MNKSVIALAATAIALGAAAVILLVQLDTEREPALAQAARASAVSMAPRPQAEAAHASAENTAAGLATPTPANTREEQHPRPAFDAAQRQSAAEYLRRAEDPAEQRVNRKHALDTARRMAAGVDRRLGITPGEYEQLVQLLADQEMDKRLASARCIVDPACVVPVLDRKVSAARGQAVRDLIGDEGLRELRVSRVTQVERDLVNGLQANLANDTPLTEMQADDLTRTLFEENRRLDREMAQRQQPSNLFGTREGAVLRYARDSPTAELALQSGEASVQAMRDRAATMLAGEQLAAFNRMYDDLLIAFRRHIRNEYAQPRSGGERT